MVVGHVVLVVEPLSRTALLSVERKTFDREQVVVLEVRDDLEIKGCISKRSKLHVTVSGAD